MDAKLRVRFSPTTLMKVTVYLKSTEKTFDNVWEVRKDILTNWNELVLVGHNHEVIYRENTSEIERIHTEV